MRHPEIQSLARACGLGKFLPAPASSSRACVWTVKIPSSRHRRPPAVLELPSCSPSAKTIPDQPNIAMPSPALNSPSQARAQIALTTRQPITQDVSDRAIAHITTGGLGKI